MAKTKKKFQPIVRDDSGVIRRRYARLSAKLGMQRQTLAQRIFEEGLALLEKQVPAEE